MKKIIIAQRGWVFVGEVTGETADKITVENAQCVRKWGTTRGLGQLAIEGPQSETKLDPVGTISFHPLAVIGQINCSEKWQ